MDLRSTRRRLGATLVATVMVASACSSSAATPTAAPVTTPGPTPAGVATPATTPATTPAHKYKVALIVGVVGDEFYTSMGCGAASEAKTLGMDYTYQGPQKFDVTLQTPILQAVIATKPDAILIAPTDPVGMFAPLKAATDAGIKVVLVDTTLTDPSIATSQISSDNTGAGKAAADAAGQLVGGPGKVMVVNTRPGISSTDDRVAGFSAEAATLKLTITSTQYTQDSATTAASEVKAELVRYPDLKAIFATSLVSAEGAAQGVQEAGLSGKVSVIAFDAGPKNVQDLKSGQIQALIAQKPMLIGSDAVQQAYNALTGQTVQTLIKTDFYTLTKANIDSLPDAPYKSTC